MAKYPDSSSAFTDIGPKNSEFPVPNTPEQMSQYQESFKEESPVEFGEFQPGDESFEVTDSEKIAKGHFSPFSTDAQTVEGKESSALQELLALKTEWNKASHYQKRTYLGHQDALKGTVGQQKGNTESGQPSVLPGEGTQYLNLSQRKKLPTGQVVFDDSQSPVVKMPFIPVGTEYTDEQNEQHRQDLMAAAYRSYPEYSVGSFRNFGPHEYGSGGKA